MQNLLASKICRLWLWICLVSIWIYKFSLCVSCKYQCEFLANPDLSLFLSLIFYLIICMISGRKIFACYCCWSLINLPHEKKQNHQKRIDDDEMLDYKKKNRSKNERQKFQRNICTLFWINHDEIKVNDKNYCLWIVWILHSLNWFTSVLNLHSELFFL